MNESQFVIKLKKYYIKLFGDDIYINKNHGNVYSSGRPDLEGCIDGNYIGIECKCIDEPKIKKEINIGKYITKKQIYNLKKIMAAGGVSAVAVYLKNKKEIIWIFDFEKTTYNIDERYNPEFAPEIKSIMFPTIIVNKKKIKGK